jgi:hypothetical protein
MKTVQANRGRLPAAATIVAVLALGMSLAACNHNDDDDHHGGAMTPPVAETPNPPTVIDAFVTYVIQLVATQDDTGEPVSVDGVTATAPENTEPQPLPAT